MATAYEVLDIAASQVGVTEYPRRSNGGPQIHEYQMTYGADYLNSPWCGSFVGWVWETAQAGWKQYASPSTAVMCDIARREGLVGPPKPGAAFVICGIHAGLLHHDLGGGVWKTIEGNASDSVSWRQRSISGLTIYAPPGLIHTPPTKQEIWYWLEDVAVHQYYGGWKTKTARDKAQKALEKKLGVRLRPFKNLKNKAAPYMLENTKVQRYYGGWKSTDAREKAKQNLQPILGRRLREFREVRTVEAN